MEELVIGIAIAFPVMVVAGLTLIAYGWSKKLKNSEVQLKEKTELIDVLKDLVELKGQLINQQRKMLGF